MGNILATLLHKCGTSAKHCRLSGPSPEVADAGKSWGGGFSVAGASAHPRPAERPRADLSRKSRSVQISHCECYGPLAAPGREMHRSGFRAELRAASLLHRSSSPPSEEAGCERRMQRYGDRPGRVVIMAESRDWGDTSIGMSPQNHFDCHFCSISKAIKLKQQIVCSHVPNEIIAQSAELLR